MGLACTRIAVTKEFIYRGSPETVVNDYCWREAAPDGSDETFWQTLAADVIRLEAGLYDSTVKFTEVYGWNDGDPHTTHVFHVKYDPSDPGIGAYVPPATAHVGAGDQAAYVQWPGSQRSTRGKQTYFRKYFHRPYIENGSADTLEPTYLAALTHYAQFTGIEQLKGPLVNQLDTPNHYKAGENHVVGTGQVGQYVTTRTLKRRGKRPRPRQ